jgi:hypothetical protein
MSEKIYAWILRLYPAHFREIHGQEALQLFRDRVRHEKGFLPGVRLWFDLFKDLLISLPREYGYERTLASVPTYQSSGGVPSFFMLVDELPRVSALFSGGALTMAALATIWTLLGHAGNFARAEAPGIGQSSDSSSSPRQFTKPETNQSESAKGRAVNAGGNLDAAEKHKVLESVIANLKAHYVDRDLGQKMSETLRIHQQCGDDDAVKDGKLFAALLTQQMREVSEDRHLTMEYSRERQPDGPARQTAEPSRLYREAMKDQNCSIEKVEILPRHIGYLKLNSFPDVSVCQAKAETAMASLNDADAIIFDLRDNRGGEPAMVMLIAGYLFDHPEYMYNPRENTTEKSWTRSPVEGNKLADKPVYILTSGATFSGAEHFTYDLKMLRRATVVGETTGGGAHSGVWHRIDDHFGMGIPETKAINPFSKTDWAEVGVEPDVPVKAAEALETAKRLALSKLRKN